MTVNDGRRSAGDDTTSVNVGEHKTMGKVEIEARTLVRVYDMAKDSFKNTAETLDDEEIPEMVRDDLQAMHTRQETALRKTEEVIEEQSKLEVDP